MANLESKPISIAEIRPPRRPRHGDRWGRWVYRTNEAQSLASAALVYEEDGHEKYYVMVLDCLTIQKRAGWLAQLAEKPWVSDEDLGRFVRALEAIVGWRKP